MLVSMISFICEHVCVYLIGCICLFCNLLKGCLYQKELMTFVLWGLAYFTKPDGFQLGPFCSPSQDFFLSMADQYSTE